MWALCISGDLLFSASSDNTIKVRHSTVGKNSNMTCVNVLFGGILAGLGHDEFQVSENSHWA